MPVYEYACRSCGRRVEVIHGINDPAPTTCEACGGVLAKVLSAPAIVFKGSGWAKKERAGVGSRGEAGDGRESGKEEKQEKSPAADGQTPSRASESAVKDRPTRSAGTPEGKGGAGGSTASKGARSGQSDSSPRADNS
jgi:putative FmdB family regulatory protein